MSHRLPQATSPGILLTIPNIATRSVCFHLKYPHEMMNRLTKHAFLLDNHPDTLLAHKQCTLAHQSLIAHVTLVSLVTSSRQHQHRLVTAQIYGDH